MKIITLLALLTLSLLIFHSSYASENSIIQFKPVGNVSVQDLDYSGKGINEFPVEILGMTDLKILDLSNNKITNIPPDIKKLKYLKVLRLNGNKIYELPADISRLKFLKEIYLDREIWQYRLNEVKKLTNAKIHLEG